eukprot:GHVR01178257.1.p2 GENE.GHVR01178257.1~~GHVR01178257.1.p2  ORF type:complete len:101 (+),score=13.92 GHVR01178257.1:1193-1495(+)
MLLSIQVCCVCVQCPDIFLLFFFSTMFVGCVYSQLFLTGGLDTVIPSSHATPYICKANSLGCDIKHVHLEEETHYSLLDCNRAAFSVILESIVATILQAQ